MTLPPPRPRLVFITGTDTGVGKTLLTALLLVHLRRNGCNAVGLKPFCSGSQADVRLLREAQENSLTAREINPFYFPEPVAPLVSARRHGRQIPINLVIKHIDSISRRFQTVLIEGSGGLLVPLGEGYTVLDLIRRLNCEVILVSRNRLGTINHTLLSLQALQGCKNTFHVSRSRLDEATRRRLTAHDCRIVLMRCRSKDSSTSSNARVLREFVAPKPLFSVPFLRAKRFNLDALKAHEKKMKKVLARIIA